ncbi:hypothetical protein BDV18DRAFT_12903 [Aspergillus unguis]
MNRQACCHQNPPKNPPAPLLPLSIAPSGEQQPPDIRHPYTHPLPILMCFVHLPPTRRRKTLHAVVARAQHDCTQEINHQMQSNRPAFCRGTGPAVHDSKGEPTLSIAMVCKDRCDYCEDDINHQNSGDGPAAEFYPLDPCAGVSLFPVDLVCEVAEGE